MNEPLPDDAGVWVPPPLIFAVCLVLGLALNAAYPFPFLPTDIAWYAGIPLMAGGMFLGGWALRAMRQAKTSPNPSSPTSTIVTTGPFGFTRNPIYLSFAISYLGIALAFNALLTLILLPLAVIAIDRLVIAREEKYLARKFGDTYTRYQNRVRRWL